MKLNYKKIGEGGHPLFVLHGLFGSLDNWQTLGRKYAEDFEVYLIDQRNHGHSPHSNEFSYGAMAQDIYELIVDLNLEKVNIIGHSMGGKTAMRFAQLYPALVDKMIVADMGIKSYPSHHDQIIEGMNALDFDVVKKRSEADVLLSKYVDNIGVRQFLLKNLYWVNNGSKKQLAWRMNLPVLESSMLKVLEALPENEVVCETLFLRGEKSNYIPEEDFQSIFDQFPNADIETIYGVGHWLHAENPDEFYRITVEFFQ